MADPYRIRTPSGRVETEYGNPPGRSYGPTQNWVPAGPPPSYHGIPLTVGLTPATITTARGVVTPFADPTPNELANQDLASIPKLTSPVINIESGTLAVPWTQFFVNLFRLAQPTGILAGVHNGITFNIYGQALSSQDSGATINSPNLTGDPQAPTPPLADNDNSIATTAFVKGQNYISTLTITGDVTGMGGSTTTVQVVGIRRHPIAAVQPQPNQVLGFVGGLWTPINVIPEAPQDDQIYGRQNGQWVVVTPVTPPPG